MTVRVQGAIVDDCRHSGPANLDTRRLPHKLEVMAMTFLHKLESLLPANDL